MICISISQESRRMALADMLNASRQCDLLEVRLDRFGKAPEIKELLDNKPKPVIMCCRRREDGGDFEGSEEERLALLRQCIISKADYVEIELDVADLIRKFPPTKRVITYINLQETPDDIAQIYAEAQTKSPDVIKLVTLARTPEEAWPLIQIVARATVPTVVVGLGKPGVMLGVLGKKIGAPWTYAALERGMEAYPGQPTVSDLRNVYHYDAITKATRLIGVTGFGELEFATVAGLNAAFAHFDVLARCLPLTLGNMNLFRKVIDALRLATVIVDEPNRDAILEIAAEVEPAAKEAGAADLMLHKSDKWHAFNTLGRAAVAAIESALKAKTHADKPLEGRMVMLVGVTAETRAITHAVKKRGGIPIIASRDRELGQATAHHFECRHVMFEGLYSTSHDVVIVCSEEKEKVRTKGRHVDVPGVHPGYLKPSMTVLDLTTMPRPSPFSLEASRTGCTVVSPRDVLLAQLEMQVRLMTGKDMPRQPMAEAIGAALPEE